MHSTDGSTRGHRETVRARVRYSETDQMGVVYHTHYLVWCEIGRTEYMRRAGLPYAQLEEQGIFLVVADASVRYHAPARYDDLVHVDAWIERARSRAVTFGYEIFRERVHAEAEDDGPVREKLASARTVLVALDAHGAARSLPPALVEQLAARAERTSVRQESAVEE
jgi:acyl-CoA thioester hydrolase